MGREESSTMRNLQILWFTNKVRGIKSRILWWATHIARVEHKSAFKILRGKPIGKRAFGRPRHR